VAPDLAVEVVSPTDIQYRVVEKAFAYLNAGTRLVWIIEPVGKAVTVYRSETDIKLLTRKDTLDGEDIVEGFSCQVSQLFE
jgi:Uma2 family endonuclease